MGVKPKPKEAEMAATGLLKLPKLPEMSETGGRFPICARCFVPVPPGAQVREVAAPTPSQPGRIVRQHLHTSCAAEFDRTAEMGRRYEALVPEPSIRTTADREA